MHPTANDPEVRRAHILACMADGIMSRRGAERMRVALNDIGQVVTCGWFDSLESTREGIEFLIGRATLPNEYVVGAIVEDPVRSLSGEIVRIHRGGFDVLLGDGGRVPGSLGWRVRSTEQ